LAHRRLADKNLYNTKFQSHKNHWNSRRLWRAGTGAPIPCWRLGLLAWRWTRVGKFGWEHSTRHY